MTVTVASFLKDFPNEFGNQSNYPPSAVAYWIAIAQVLFGLSTGGTPQVCSLTGSIDINGVLNVTEFGYGSLTLFPLMLQGDGLPSNATILSQVSGNPGDIGTFQTNVKEVIVSESMVALRSVPAGVGPLNFWGASSLTADSPPTTVVDFATEMWVAHQLVLEKQAADAARTGGDPGTKVGVIASKSVNGVSVSFDTSSILAGNMQENAGYYGQTIYGLRFYRLMKIRGAGGVQVGIGQAPAFLFFNDFGLLGSSNAWGGPYTFPQQGGTSFV